jgi:hypothetical protein
MFKRPFGPRKQRTRQHVIADQSIHHIEGFILEEGHTAQRLEKDYGYDLIVFTYDEGGYVEPGLILFQLKASETLKSGFLNETRSYWFCMKHRGNKHIGSASRTFLGSNRNSAQRKVRELFACECQENKS